MRAVGVCIADKKKKWRVRGLRAGVMIFEEANRLLGKKWRLESVRCNAFPVVGEVLLAGVRILAHPITEPEIESRMRIPFFSTVPLTHQTRVITGRFQQLRNERLPFQPRIGIGLFGLFNPIVDAMLRWHAAGEETGPGRRAYG